MERDLEQTIKRYDESIAAVVRGEPEPQKQLWSRRDDITLANPLGPPARGWSEVEKTLEHATSLMRAGEVYARERVSEYATPDMAYTLEIERSRAKFGGSDEFAPVSLRVTTIWRREEDGWRILHRHADPITTPRPLDSMFER